MSIGRDKLKRAVDGILKTRDAKWRIEYTWSMKGDPGELGRKSNGVDLVTASSESEARSVATRKNNDLKGFSITKVERTSDVARDGIDIIRYSPERSFLLGKNGYDKFIVQGVNQRNGPGATQEFNTQQEAEKHFNWLISEYEG